MRYVNVVNYESMGVDYYTLDFKWKDSIWVKEDHTTVKRTSELHWSRHFMSWRRFKKLLKKNNATFINKEKANEYQY